MRNGWLWLLAAWYLLTKGGTAMQAMQVKLENWPVRVLGPEGARPSTITQEFKGATHPGVDISVPGHYQDAIADVVAAVPGSVLEVYQSKRGWVVTVGSVWVRVGYVHLSGVDQDIAKGVKVAAGQRLGRMGADPTDPEGVVHLHFQMDDGIGPAFDPAPSLRGLTPT